MKDQGTVLFQKNIYKTCQRGASPCLNTKEISEEGTKTLLIHADSPPYPVSRFIAWRAKEVRDMESTEPKTAFHNTKIFQYILQLNIHVNLLKNIHALPILFVYLHQKHKYLFEFYSLRYKNMKLNSPSMPGK